MECQKKEWKNCCDFSANNVKKREDVSKLIHQFNAPQAGKQEPQKEAQIQVQTAMPQKPQQLSSPTKSSPVKRAMPLENNLDAFNKIFKEQDQKLEKQEQKKEENKERPAEVEEIVSEEENPTRKEVHQMRPQIQSVQAQESEEDKEDEEETISSESTEEEIEVESPPIEKQAALICENEEKEEDAEEEHAQMLEDLKLSTDANFEHLEQEEQNDDIREEVPGGSPTNSTNSSSRSNSAELEKEERIAVRKKL